MNTPMITATAGKPIRCHKPRSTAQQLSWWLLTVLLAGSLAVATEEPAQWYQIELILFARHPEAVADPEVWHRQITPRYPENLRVLAQYQPPTLLQKRDTASNETLVSEQPVERQPDRLSGQQEAAPTDAFPQDGAHTPTSSQAPAEDDLLTPIALSKLPQRLTPPTDLTQEPYVLLPANQFELNNLHRRIREDTDKRLLLHAAWRQPVEAHGVAEPVLIQTGEQYGILFEVEGMVTLKKSRHLHIDTDLVYTKFQRQLLNNGLHWEIFDRQASVPPLDNLSADMLGRFSSSTHQASEYQAELTTALRQTRRIKPSELHYLDHPLLGMLVSVSEYQPPDPVLEMPEFDLDSLPPRKPLPATTAESPATAAVAR